MKDLKKKMAEYKLAREVKLAVPWDLERNGYFKLIIKHLSMLKFRTCMRNMEAKQMVQVLLFQISPAVQIKVEYERMYQP